MAAASSSATTSVFDGVEAARLRAPVSMENPIGFVAWPITARRAAKRLKLERRRKGAEEEEELEDEEADEEDGEALIEDLEGEANGSGEPVAEADLVGAGVLVDMEVDLDRGLREEAARLPNAEVTEVDSRGKEFINRSKVIDALIKRGRSRSVWEQLPLDGAPWKCMDCPNPGGVQVPTLEYGLESIVEMRGRIVPVALLPVEQRRELRLVVQVEDIDPGAMPTFVPPWRDQRLERLALQRSCRFFSSTSSLTGLLSKCYFAISRHYGIDVLGLSGGFRQRTTSHGPSALWPSVVYLRRTPCGQAWSITDAGDQWDDEQDNRILSKLGTTMEHQVKMRKSDFDARFRRGSPGARQAVAQMDEEEARAYRFLEVGPFLMRSQLDARHKDLIFDLKTRAVAPIRYVQSEYKTRRKYRIGKLLGQGKSYENEIYDMMRLAFLKYGLQARIGRMDGVFVTYHNTVEIFGFQYIPLLDMDRCIYGGRGAALSAFDLSSKLLAAVMRLLTEDADLAKTGTIKVMFYSHPAAGAGADGSREGASGALDVSAAPVHGADTPQERLEAVRSWRVNVDLKRPDGGAHPADQPLSEDLRVHLSAWEVAVGSRR